MTGDDPRPLVFPPEEKTRRHARRRAIGGAVAAALFVTPGLLALVAAVLTVPFDLQLAKGLSSTVVVLLNPVPLLFLVGFLAWAFADVRRLSSRVVLEAEHLQIPGTPGSAHGLEDGYRYAHEDQRLVVRVPYGRVRDVRRVTDPAERPRRAPAGPPLAVRHRKKRDRRLRVRGHVLVGAGAEEGAPALLAEELARCWVTDPDQTVAITFHGLARGPSRYPALPEWVERPTLYVSVDDPDGLVAELTARVLAVEPLTTIPEAVQVWRPPVPARDEAAPAPDPEVRTARPRPPPVDPLRAAADGWRAVVEHPVGRRVVDLGTGAIWFTVVALLAWVGALVATTVLAVRAYGPLLARDANIIVLVIVAGYTTLAYAPWAALLGLLEAVASLVGGFRPFWRRVVWTVLLAGTGVAATLVTADALTRPPLGPPVAMPR